MHHICMLYTILACYDWPTRLSLFSQDSTALWYIPLQNGMYHIGILCTILANYNWPITVFSGLDLKPPACLASLSVGAGAAVHNMDYNDAGFDNDGSTRPPRRQQQT